MELKLNSFKWGNTTYWEVRTFPKDFRIAPHGLSKKMALDNWWRLYEEKIESPLPLLLNLMDSLLTKI